MGNTVSGSPNEALAWLGEWSMVSCEWGKNDYVAIICITITVPGVTHLYCYNSIRQ